MFRQFLADSTCGFSGPGVLDTDDLDEVWYATKIVLFILGACQALDVDRDGRVRLLLYTAIKTIRNKAETRRHDTANTVEQ